MIERRYSAMEVARIAGVTYKQIDHWVRTGHLAASVAPAGGSGNPRLFGFSDVAKAVALAYLSRDMGVVLSVADRVLVDCHRKAKCTADFGAVRLTVDMSAVRQKVAAVTP